jgi:hypothetical protein
MSLGGRARLVTMAPFLQVLESMCSSSKASPAPKIDGRCWWMLLVHLSFNYQELTGIMSSILGYGFKFLDENLMSMGPPFIGDSSSSHRMRRPFCLSINKSFLARIKDQNGKGVISSGMNSYPSWTPPSGRVSTGSGGRGNSGSTRLMGRRLGPLPGRRGRSRGGSAGPTVGFRPIAKGNTNWLLIQIQI